MNFKKRLNTRLYFALSFSIIGIALIIISAITNVLDGFLGPWGLGLLIIGIARVRNHFLITKNEETLRNREIAENDERNITIVNKARSISFILYILIASIAVIILQILNQTEVAIIVSFSVCALILIYWISYFIISRKY